MEEIFSRNGIKLAWENIEYDEIQDDTTEAISMRSCMDLSGKVRTPFFLEDTGLYIDALNGFPGPYSSYVIRKIGLSGILSLLTGQRGAEFKTVITLDSGSEYLQFTGILRGSISMEPRGSSGFGYDPIFVPEGAVKTLAEMSLEEKNAISHRSIATGKLISYILSRESKDKFQ